MDGTPGLANGMRQIGHFLFLWTLRSEAAFVSEMIKNGLGHEVRGGGGRGGGVTGMGDSEG